MAPNQGMGALEIIFEKAETINSLPGRRPGFEIDTYRPISFEDRRIMSRMELCWLKNDWKCLITSIGVKGVFPLVPLHPGTAIGIKFGIL